MSLAAPSLYEFKNWDYIENISENLLCTLSLKLIRGLIIFIFMGHVALIFCREGVRGGHVVIVFVQNCNHVLVSHTTLTSIIFLFHVAEWMRENLKWIDLDNEIIQMKIRLKPSNL